MIRPRVSVLLPVRNAQGTLPAAIDSLRAQTLSDWECLAVDDGSTDATGSWLDAATLRDPRLRVIHTPPRGIVHALNLALEHARADRIARLDADDVCLPDRLGLQAKYLDAHPDIGLVASRVAFDGDPHGNAGYASHVDWLNSVLTEQAILHARFIESPFAHPSVMFRRSVVDALGGYRDGDFPEDYELWLRWLDAGVRMAKLPEVLLRWSDPPGRLSRTDPRYRPDAFYRLKADWFARWWNHTVATHEPTRRLWVWGAGRLTRRRVDLLLPHGLVIERFIDIDPKKHGTHRDGRTVVGRDSLPPPGSVFVLGYVARRGARDIQRPFLLQRGYMEGRDFLFAA
jgi:glycosyltransferase involved in cell wall biosynthesis